MFFVGFTGELKFPALKQEAYAAMRSRTCEVAARNDLPIPSTQRTIIKTTARTTAPIRPSQKSHAAGRRIQDDLAARAFSAGYYF
jgi:hypothetical protein